MSKSLSENQILNNRLSDNTILLKLKQLLYLELEKIANSACTVNNEKSNIHDQQSAPILQKLLADTRKEINKCDKANSDDNNNKLDEDIEWIPSYFTGTPDTHPLIPLPRPETVELRNGFLISGCDCLKRNGLQADCLRSLCQGKDSCLKWPAPNCEPSGLAPPVRRSSFVKFTESPICSEEYYKEPQIRKNRCSYTTAGREGYQDNPPYQKRSQIPCKYHKRIYVRPLMKTTNTQTD